MKKKTQGLQSRDTVRSIIRFLYSQLWTPTKMFQKADEFFQSIGLDPMPDEVTSHPITFSLMYYTSYKKWLSMNVWIRGGLLIVLRIVDYSSTCNLFQNSSEVASMHTGTRFLEISLKIIQYLLETIPMTGWNWHSFGKYPKGICYPLAK